MITEMHRRELEKIKPPKYREKVQTYLTQHGHSFSLETIQKVYSGKRNNLTVAKAIINVFHEYMKEQQVINTSFSKLLKQTNKKP